MNHPDIKHRARRALVVISEFNTRADNMFEYLARPVARAVSLEPLRADQLCHQGNLNQQIDILLEEAPVVLADVTEGNSNVMHELACRQNKGKPYVIVAEAGTNLPFRIREERVFFFDPRDVQSVDRCRQQIVEAVAVELNGRQLQLLETTP
jgi:hypothetical protein